MSTAASATNPAATCHSRRPNVQPTTSIDPANPSVRTASTNSRSTASPRVTPMAIHAASSEECGHGDAGGPRETGARDEAQCAGETQRPPDEHEHLASREVLVRTASQRRNDQPGGQERRQHPPYGGALGVRVAEHGTYRVSVRLYGLVSLIVAAALADLRRAGRRSEPSTAASRRASPFPTSTAQPAATGPRGRPAAPPRPPLEEQLPPSIVKKLEREGAAGEALLELPRVAPAAVVRAQTGGRAKKVVDAERLLAIGALGTPIKPESAARILAKTATLGEGFAKTFRWGLLVTTFLLVGASWLRYRARSARLIDARSRRVAAVRIGRRPSRDEELRRVYQENVAAVYALPRVLGFPGRGRGSHVGDVRARPAVVGQLRPVAIERARLDPRHRPASAHRPLPPAAPPGRAFARRASGDPRHAASSPTTPRRRFLETETAKSWLGELSQRERDVLAMRYGADMTAAEIARALDLSEANVHQINSRALRRLRELLTERPELMGNA